MYRTYGTPAGGAPLSVAAPNRRDGGPIRAATGRKVIGPGGPRDDLIPAMTAAGARYLLSNGEWIVNAAVSAMQGDLRMRALNDGRAQIVMNPPSPTAMPGYGSSGAGLGRAGAGPMNVRADVRVFIGDREITDIARVEAEAVVADGFEYFGTRLN